MNVAALMQRARSHQAMVAVVFTREKPGTFDPLTETHSTPTSSSIACKAVQIDGDPDRYEALGLSLITMPTLLVIPNAVGLAANTDAFVRPGDTVWNNVTMTVKDVDPVAPSGSVVSARIVVSA